MAFKLFGNKKEEKNYLEMTPLAVVKHEVNDEGKVNLLIPRFKSDFMIKYFLPKNKSLYIRVNLDEFGSSTWKLIDGETRVDEIGRKLIEIFGEEVHPVNDRLTEFLTTLYSNGFISFNELTKR